MEFRGVIRNVTDEPIGSTLEEAVSAGATVIRPANPDRFSPEGGRLQIGEEVRSYVHNGETLTLDEPLDQAYDEDTPVFVYPRAVERWAWVQEPGAEEEVQVRVPHALWDRIAPGIRQPHEAEQVEAILTGEGVAVLTDVLGREPRVDGGFIRSHTIRPEAITDGEPPASSPTPEVSGGIGSLVVKWDAISNHDPVVYEVHLSSSSGFTPGPSTLAAEVQGTIVFLRTLPTGGALQGGTTYYVRLIARDADGAAAPSAEASGEIVVLNTADIPSDGQAPPQVDMPSVTPGPGFLFVEWTPVENADPVAYEVHVGDNPLFTPGPSTLYATTPATSIVVSKEPDGSDLDLGQLYYLSIVATDPDGAATPSGVSVGVAPAAQITETLIANNAISTPKLQANSVVAGKIAANAVTAGAIAANAVTSAKIAANAVTAAKIAANAVTAEKIDTGAVTAEKILADEALFELLQTVLLISNTIKVPSDVGQRLELSQAGMKFFDGAGQLTANFSTTGGSAFLRGIIEFGSGSRLSPDDTIALRAQPSDFLEPKVLQSAEKVGSATSTGAWNFPGSTWGNTVPLILVATAADVTHGTVTGWTVDVTTTISVPGGGRVRLSLYRRNIATPIINLPSIPFSGLSPYVAMAFEVHGIDNLPPDRTAINSGISTGTVTAGPTAPNTQTHCFVIGAHAAVKISAAQPLPSFSNPNAPFVELNQLGHVQRGAEFTRGLALAAWSKNVTESQPQAISATLDNADAWAGLVAAYKARSASEPDAPDTDSTALYAKSDGLYTMDGLGHVRKLATTDLIPGKMAAGTVVLPTSGGGSATATVPHGLGVTPSQVLCTARDGTAVLRVSSRNSTNFTVDAFHRDAGSTFSVNVPVDWLAIA